MQLGSASLSGPVNLGVGKSKSDFVFIRDAVIAQRSRAIFCT